MSADDKGPIEWTLPGAISCRLHVETWDGLGPHYQRPATSADLLAAGFVPASLATAERLRAEKAEGEAARLAILDSLEELERGPR